MECTKCGKLAPQEWDLTANTREALSVLDRRFTNGGRKQFKHIRKKKLCQTQTEWHKVIHPPATPKTYKGNSFVLRQGPHNVGNHKVHIALQNKAWVEQVRASCFRTLLWFNRQKSSVYSDPKSETTMWAYYMFPIHNPFKHEWSSTNLSGRKRREKLSKCFHKPRKDRTCQPALRGWAASGPVNGLQLICFLYSSKASENNVLRYSRWINHATGKCRSAATATKGRVM